MSILPIVLSQEELPYRVNNPAYPIFWFLADKELHFYAIFSKGVKFLGEYTLDFVDNEYYKVTPLTATKLLLYHQKDISYLDLTDMSRVQLAPAINILATPADAPILHRYYNGRGRTLIPVICGKTLYVPHEVVFPTESYTYRTFNLPSIQEKDRVTFKGIVYAMYDATTYVYARINFQAAHPIVFYYTAAHLEQDLLLQSYTVAEICKLCHHWYNNHAHFVTATRGYIDAFAKVKLFDIVDNKVEEIKLPGAPDWGHVIGYPERNWQVTPDLTVSKKDKVWAVGDREFGRITRYYKCGLLLADPDEMVIRLLPMLPFPKDLFRIVVDYIV